MRVICCYSKKNCKKNKELQKAVDNYDQVKLLSKQLLELDITRTITSLEKDSTDKNLKSHKQNKVITVLTLLFLLIGIAVLLYKHNTQNQKNKTKILAEYIKPIDPNSTKSIVDTSDLDLFEKGKLYFTLNRFEESKRYFTLYLSQNHQKDSLSRGHFWLGSAHLELWETKKRLFIGRKVKKKKQLKI